MDVFWIPLLAILTLLHPTTSTSDPTEVIGVLGGSVTFHTHNTGGKPALWFFGTEAIMTVVFEDPPRRPVFHKDEFKTRFAVSENGRALSISQLRMEDAGTYSVTIDGKKSTFTLQVFRELAEPTVTCEAQNCSDGSCSFSLRCSVPGAGLGNVSYSWRVRDRPQDGGSVVLWVNESSREEPEPLTCTARNPVSSRNVTVTTPGVLCSGALSSSQVGVRGGVVIVVGILVAAFLSLCLVFLGKSKGWRKFHLSNSKPADTAATDYTTVYAEVGPSQQGVPNGMKAKPTDGGSATTIYSLVKRPEQADDGTAENAAVTGLELV
ncbi:T-lymphocyte surface antigen Ly-9-like isoform X2 [Pyrgilauda ruficollis]|uniref:T-lymphocyte surface antigen Ly-9-like isoform X2 n=1 Tax=Pyrgilauda ruficollis TaxID=221976 RepID=UPI001B87A2C1|nr:T-lymphocyte surface antigen Ly-9-like isoform X2 [Pyrgilauda ruficollis]